MQDYSKKRILVVDSNPAIADDFKKIFSPIPESLKQKNKLQPIYVLEYAATLDIAIQLIQQSMVEQKPFLVAMIDLYQKSDDNKLEMLQRMWEIDPHLQMIFNIAFTPYRYQDLVTQLQRSDRFYILNKPYEANEVRQIMLHLAQQQNLSFSVAQNIKNLESKINHQYTHDNLTDLGNRFLLSQHASFLLTQAQQVGSKLGVAILAIDNLKEIKTLYGFSAVDNFITQIAKKLRQFCSQSDMLIRWSSEEFLIIFSSQLNEEYIKNKINEIADYFSRPMEVDSQLLVVSMHVGVSIYPHDGKDLETLLKNAQAALSYSKKPVKKSIQFFNQSEHNAQLRRAELRVALPLAIKNSQFLLHFQPLIKSDSSEILGVEALIRWQHPTYGLLFPQEFISLAEELGLIYAIDEWVLKTAVTKVKKWQETINPELGLSVNVSSYQICQPNFEFLVQKILKTVEFKALHLEFDLIANPLLKEDPDTLSKMTRLKESGIRFCLDNFGVGYSNLDYLQFFPFDKVKIDKSFVKDIQLNVKQNKAIEAIIYFAKKMGVKVVAGGVETPQQVEFLFSHHGEEMQGFYFSPPLNEEACGILLKKQSAIVRQEDQV